MSNLERGEYERHRNCAHCGQRLVHTQYDDEGATVFTKRCPRYNMAVSDLGNLHDFLEYRHEYPYRNRRGQNSEGTKLRLEGRSFGSDTQVVRS